jgi:YHS domain-containing protein
VRLDARVETVEGNLEMKLNQKIQKWLKTAAICCAAALSIFAVIAPQEAFARKAETYVGLLQKAALGGYDPVSYFSGKPVQGSEANQVVHNGGTYYFATPANAAKFKANPAAYAPQYGGYCAWAVAQGKTAPGDPKLWKVVGGKLYVNYNSDIQKKWEKDIPGFITKGDANWPKVLN